MGRHPNSLAALRAHEFKSGAEWNGNTKTRRCGASIKEWWNALSKENDDGVAKYTMEQIEDITNAPADDPKVSPAKRIAARHIIEMAKGGRTGREITALVFDRTEGKAPQQLHMTGGPEVKRIILMGQDELPALPPADEVDGA